MRLPSPALLWLAVLLAPAGAGAASLDVSPVRIELSARSPSALVVLKNGGKALVRVELRAQAWDEGPTGGMLLTDTTELSVFPALQQLAPGEERKIRIGTTARPGGAERSWRVFISEMPSAVEVADKTAVRVLTRIGIPVFLAPLKATTGAALSVTRDGGKLAVVFKNTGSVRIDPTEVKLLLLGEKDARIEERTFSGWYVLAGRERVFTAEPEAGGCAGVRNAVATAEVGSSQLQAVLPLPAGICAP